MKIAFRSKNKKLFNLAPTRIIVLSFVLLILVGTVLLNLPVASRNGTSAGFLTALFTATSATCVTGLVVVDTYTQWSLFGQLVILLLVQAGGLGFVTLATFFSVLLGRKVGLKGMLLAQESINHFSFEGVVRVIKKVVIVTMVIETVGALLLSIYFVPRYGLEGFYYGIFHAVTAFCNAGFDITGDYRSLTGFASNPLVLYTIAGLIIVGGLGFMVWKDLYEFRKNKDLYLHTKLVLISTVSLIFIGSVLFFTFEYNNQYTLGGLSLFDKLNNAFFHSVTCRTAGFNSLPTNEMYETSKVATIILMFIGAAPGSTGGGIKITTFSVVIMAIACQIKGSDDIIILKKRVPHYIVFKALAIIGLSLSLVVVLTTTLLAIEKGPMINNVTINMVNVLYEATSAFGTVGLSTGITGGLQPISKVLLIITMFLGRVGPMTFALALALRNKSHTDVVYPEGKIVVG